jgi:hypothetical protein
MKAKQFLKLICLLLFPIAMMAQNPGGVPTAPTLWYRADAPTTITITAGSSVTQWRSFVNNNTNNVLVPTIYNSHGTGQFSAGNRSTNFFPIVNFSDTQGMISNGDPLGLAGGTAYAMFLGSRMEKLGNNASNSMAHFTNPGNNDIRPGLGNFNDGSLLVAQHRQFGVCGNTTNYGITKSLSPNFTSVISGARSGTSVFTSHLGSETTTSTSNYTCVIEKQLRMGRAISSENNNNWGGVQEFIMFTGTTLTPTQRRQVETPDLSTLVRQI